jgi:tellurium resistance protein TerD
MPVVCALWVNNSAWLCKPRLLPQRKGISHGRITAERRLRKPLQRSTGPERHRCCENEKVLSDNAFIFYNNKTSPCGNVVHNGDNRSGEGEGDDETVNVNLAGLPEEAKKLAFSVTIHDAAGRNQNFGQVSKAYIRVLNKKDNSEIARFDLSEDASVETAMIFGEVYRHNGEWKFKAIGQGFAGGLAPLASNYGVSV